MTGPPTAGPQPAPGAPPGRGLFVAFEGGDGAGKSTQIALLRDWLQDHGRPVRVTREPGGTPLGQAIRSLVLHGEHVSPRAEALLFAADRAHHVDTVVRPALDRGEDVLTDRYLDSSVAYQGAGRELGVAEVRDLSLWATQGLLPDLTVLLDVSAEEGVRRRRREGDRMESEPGGFHDRVRRHFLDLAAADPGRYLVVDATDAVEAVARRVVQRMASLVGSP